MAEFEDSQVRRRLDGWRVWTRPLVVWLNTHQPSESTVLIGTALVVGVGAGFGAIVFRWLIGSIQQLAFGGGQQVLGFMGRAYVIFIPAIGGLFVGPMVYFLAREAKGHGVPEVMEAVALRGGRIRPIVVVVKALASSICIGTGGSVGREGPIVQIGSAFGSTVGQALRMSDDRIKTLVACGAAGGISGTFNAPIGGVIFALEVILGEFAVGHFSTVVISSVVADVIVRIVLGNAPAFVVPQYALNSPWELPLYVVLGILAAPVAVIFVRLLYWSEDVFEAWRFPEYIKPAIGGLGVGIIGVFAPQVFGVGYETIESALRNEIVYTAAITLLVLKLVATSLTLGSGGSGGVFAPSLFLGAMLGGAFGDVAHRWLPNIAALPGAYAVVGMAAVFSAGARAPITAILILFEMTGDYQIILPLMLATVIATLVAQRLEPESIYTMKLVRRGVRLQHGRDIDVMQSVQVSEIMTTDIKPVPASMKVEELAELFEKELRHAFPVVDEKGELYGIVSIQDLERALVEGNGEDLTVGDIATRSVITVFPDEPVWVALKHMAPRDLSSLPVVDRANPRRLLGLIRRRDIVRAYNLAIIRRQEIQHRLDQLRLGRVTGTKFVELEIPPDSPAVGRRLEEVTLPRDCVIVAIRRGRRVLIPHGDTVLEPGDRVTTFVEVEDEDALRASLGLQEAAVSSAVE